ncbi:MAG: HD domain-containing phosphohydrolase [Carboxydocellales bacterium]
MNKTMVADLRTGMKLAESIFSDNKQILVAEGTLLTESIINRLQEIKRHVYIYDENTIEADPGEVLTNRVLANTLNKLHTYLPFELYPESDNQVNEKFERLNKLLQIIISHPMVADFLLDLRTIDELSLEHSLNVCVFSLLIGAGLELPESLMVYLGKGAITHDIGKMSLPIEIRGNFNNLSPKDQLVYKEHTNNGYRLLREKGFESQVAKVALYHHERWDGGGYPTKLEGEKIDLLSRIVNIADVYDNLTSTLADTSYLPHEAIEYLYGAGDMYFDARIVRAFIYNVAIYPLGSIVKLSTGEVGIVVNVAKNISSRPIVKICYDKENQKLKYYHQKDLYQEKTVFITKVLL